MPKYSNGDTIAVPGHYGCHCIQVVEEIPTTCALSESRRKALYRCTDIHHMLNIAKNDLPFISLFSAVYSLGKVLRNFLIHFKVEWRDFARASVVKSTDSSVPAFLKYQKYREPV